jgi:hypothetical protein
MAQHKPKNELEEAKEREEKARRKYFKEKREKQLKRRTGLTRKNQQLFLRGVKVALAETPVLIRERIYRKYMGRHSRRTGAPKCDNIHFSIWRYTFQGDNGTIYSVLQGKVFDADNGHCVSVTGFWGLTPA